MEGVLRGLERGCMERGEEVKIVVLGIGFRTEEEGIDERVGGIENFF